MALKTLKTFNTVDKKFDPETTIDKSTDNLLFNAQQVENTSNSFSSWMEEWKNNLNNVIDIIKDPAKNMPMPGDFEDGGLYL